MTDRQRRTEFKDLVTTRRAELGISLRKLADACIDPEEGEAPITHGWLGKLERGGTVTPPDEVALRALAVGLKVPFRMVQEAAAAQFFGLKVQWSADGTTRMLVQYATELEPGEVEHLAEIAKTFAGRRERRLAE